jgi:hypothetical protein
MDFYQWLKITGLYYRAVKVKDGDNDAPHSIWDFRPPVIEASYLEPTTELDKKRQEMLE